jgi:GTPase SAR1 family protein
MAFPHFKNLWDMAGEEQFQALSTIYDRGTRAAVAVFAMDHCDSLESLPEQNNHFLEAANNAGIAVVGNGIQELLI